MAKRAESPLTRRRFLLGVGGAAVLAGCSDGISADGGFDGGLDGGIDSGGIDSGMDGDLLDAGGDTTPPADAGMPRPWQLAEGHYEGYLPLHAIYPRPDSETQAYARHRHAYPGVRYEIPIGVQFGKWPYRYELVSGPAGARIVHETPQWNDVDKFEIPEGYGVVEWEVPAGDSGTHTFLVRVYDQDHDRPSPSFVDVEWTTRVGTEQFIFLDPVNGVDAAADGTIDGPFKEISALQDSGLGANKVCYVRQTTLFDPDSSLFSGGYVPTPARQFRFGPASEPKAYVAFPGETVHINTAGQTGFAQSTETNEDVFFAGLTVGFTNQTNRNAGNVRVIIHRNRAHRSTFWKMGCVRAYGGNVKNDNHGFIWYLQAGGSVEDATGHTYVYGVDCWMDQMNIDLGPDAAFDGVGSNGAHLWETYTSNWSLAERMIVTNSRIVNNGFIINKGSTRDGEIRACDTTKGNMGNYHIRCLGAASQGETQRVVLCWNKTGSASNESGRVSMGQASVSTSYLDVYSYRNSCAGRIDAATAADALSHAYNNLAEEIAGNVKMSRGNVEHAGDIASFFDADMNLIGSARAEHLGTKGAEIA